MPHLPRLRTCVTLPLLLLSLAGSVGMAGCSNDPYPKGETAGSVIYRALQVDLRTLDPSVAYTVDESAIVDLMYPSYYGYHYLKQAPFELVLGLGAKEPERERSTFTDPKTGKTGIGETWTFRIKPGLKFQDDPCFPDGKGREITAADFLFSFRRMADPRLTPPCPVTSFIEDKILGFHDYVVLNQKRHAAKLAPDYAAPVAGLQLDPNDKYTFRVQLNQPYPQLRYLMAMHFTSPLAHEAVEKDANALRDHPVGSGPFLVEEYTKKRRLVLRANPNRRDERYPSDAAPGTDPELLKDAGKRLPLADRIIFGFQRETVTIWNMFLQGYIDRWSVTQENMQQVMGRQGGLSPEMQQRGIRMLKTSSPNVYYFGFNMEDPVVGGYTEKKRKLRQAISLAIDSQAFIDLFYQGVGTQAQSPLPPGILGYDPTYKNPYRQYDPDLKRAKQLLAEAGYPGGIDPKTGERLTLYFDNSGTTAAGRQMVGLTQKQVEALGIRLESRVSRDVVWQDRVDKGEFQFVRYGWFADYPDPENFLFLMYGPNKRPGPNHTAYRNPEYDRLFEQMRVMDDGPERQAIIKRMRDIVVEDAVWIPVNHDEDLLLVYDWLHNVVPHGVANDTAKYWSVDGAERVARQRAWNQPNFWPALAILLVLVLGSVPAAGVVKRHRNRRLRRKGGEER